MQELKRIRNERGWSQRRLATEAGVDQVTVNHIETGKRSPNVETLEKLARALDVEVADFFPKAEPLLFERDETAEMLATASDTELGDLYEELLHQVDTLRDQGKRDGAEFGRTMVKVLKVFNERQARDRSREKV